VPYANLVHDASDFERLGEDFAGTGLQRSGPVGAGVAHMMRARDVVDFATSWMAEHRYGPG
jgi:aminoglycoside 3-N-acetyltransferase